MRMIGKLAGKKSIHLISSDEQQSMTRLISGPAEAEFRHFIFVFMSYVLHCFTINHHFKSKSWYIDYTLYILSTVKIYVPICIYTVFVYLYISFYVMYIYILYGLFPAQFWTEAK